MMRVSGRVTRAFLLLAVPALVLATDTFQRRWHWFREAAGHSAAQTTDGGYFVSGETWIDALNYGIVVARTDALGDTVWVRHVTNLEADGGYSCRVNDGGCVVIGSRSDGIIARKYTTGGDSVWAYATAERGPISTVIPTFDGGCLITGRIPDTIYDFGAIKLRPDGSEEWSRYYDEPRVFDSWARGAAQTHDSGYVLCGDASDYVGAYLRMVRVNQAGESLWSRIYTGYIGPSLRAVKETPDHGYLAVGFNFDTLNARNALYIMRTDSVGSIIWSRHVVHPGAATDGAALSDTRDGGYVIAGTVDWGDSARVWLVKTNAAGDTVWTSVLGGPGRETGTDVKQTADAGYVIAGATDYAGGSILVFKTDSLGRMAIGIAEDRATPHLSPLTISVSPNPARPGPVLVRMTPGLSGPAAPLLSVFDISGRLVLLSSLVTRNPQLLLDVRGLRSGVYVLRLEQGGIPATQKLVIQ